MLLLCLAWGCNKTPEQPTQNTPEILIQIGDSILTRDMVVQRIPAGLSAADSIRMFDAIAQAWVDRNMLVTLAGSQLPDIEKIEHLVQQYRQQLLADEYRRMMADEARIQITPDDITTYYNTHSQSFILHTPLVKGIYLKINSNAPQIDEIRTWMDSAQSADIDNLETYGLRGAMEYDYFGDTWIDWQTIADHIPYRFTDPDKFLQNNRFFVWEDNGATYMLRILDCIPSGEPMPHEYAEAEIKEKILDSRRRDYDRHLLHSLYEKGIKDKQIILGKYTPVNYRP